MVDGYYLVPGKRSQVETDVKLKGCEKLSTHGTPIQLVVDMPEEWANRS
jgi:hypothetical protein